MSWDARSSGDLLGVNGCHAGLCRSLVQLASLGWSDEVGVGRQGCCTSLLYLYGLALEDGVERDVSQRAVPGTARRRRRAFVRFR